MTIYRIIQTEQTQILNKEFNSDIVVGKVFNIFINNVPYNFEVKRSYFNGKKYKLRDIVTNKYSIIQVI
jgi:hypothetical protein